MKYFYCKDTISTYVFETDDNDSILKHWQKYIGEKEFRLVYETTMDDGFRYLNSVRSNFFSCRYLKEISKSEAFIELL